MPFFLLMYLMSFFSFSFIFSFLYLLYVSLHPFSLVSFCVILLSLDSLLLFTHSLTHSLFSVFLPSLFVSFTDPQTFPSFSLSESFCSLLTLSCFSLFLSLNISFLYLYICFFLTSPIILSFTLFWIILLSFDTPFPLSHPLTLFSFFSICLFL